MKYFLCLFFTLFLFCNTSAYRWEITNYAEPGEVKVCTTPGIKSCQTKNLGYGQTGTFEFNKWYNKGLCLNQIKINGKKVDLDPNQEIKKDAHKGIYGGPLGMEIGGLVGAIKATCSNKSLKIIIHNGKYYAVL